MDLASYSAEAEQFVSALDREYYLHFAGHKQAFEIEPIYERHAGLFGRGAVESLRESLDGARGDQARRLRYLLQFAVDGLIGQETKSQAATLAEREAAIELRFDGRTELYRQATIVQANEPDPELRAAIERARLEALEAQLNPLHLEAIERAHALAGELGWPSYGAMYAQLKGVDLERLERQTRSFSEATDARYPDVVEPQLLAETGMRLSELRRSDLAWFFRAPTHDRLFPAERLEQAFERTLAGLGIDLRAQANVKLDVEQRPRKSPRAFCAPVRVPQEVYLVIPRRGGRDDYSALFHEGGHTEHYANVDPSLPFEFRYLGDNSVTEGFAFLLEHLVEDREWLRVVLGAEDVETYLDYARASKLVFLRRYAAKLAYELELHGDRRPLAEMRDLYARSLTGAVGIEWPSTTWLDDVDDGFYAANYLRAWAFEAELRRLLRDRFGSRWFEHAEAGEMLRSLWREGQRLGADELLAGLGAGPLDFTRMEREI